MKLNRQKGLTLVELVVAISIGMIVLGSIYSMVLTGLRSSSSLEMKVTAGQDVRAALELMAMEIRMASYNPTFVSGLWKDATGAVSSHQNYRGIQSATQNSILVEMDIQGNSDVEDSNEIIAYSLDTINKYITRRTGTAGIAQPFLGADPAQVDQERTVRVINSDLNIPIFTYFDGNGAAIPYTGLPGSIPKIRRIQIVLVVETDDLDINTHLRKRIIYSTSVIPRNHASFS